MTEKEKLQLESERLDREMIGVLKAISLVSGRLAHNLEEKTKAPGKKFKSDKSDTLKRAGICNDI